MESATQNHSCSPREQRGIVNKKIMWINDFYVTLDYIEISIALWRVKKPLLFDLSAKFVYLGIGPYLLPVALSNVQISK